MSAIAATMWWLVYLDGQARLLVQGPDKAKVEEQVRIMMMGAGVTDVEVKTIFEASTEDALRVGFVGIQGLLNGVHPNVQWWIGYFNENPSLLIASPGTAETATNNVRQAMLGRIPDGATFSVKPIYEAPIDDVIRASLMGILTTLGAFIQAAASRPPLRH